MEIKSPCRQQETLCVSINKVYDWIIEESTGSTSISLAKLPISLPEDATNVVANCVLTDANGVPLPVNAQVDVSETAPREDRQFEVNGNLVTLQRVTFKKTLYVVLEISGVDAATGTQFFITSNPAPFNFIEMAFLCAPAGTSLIVWISNFSCFTVVNRNAEGDITSFGLQIFVCQSIQTVSPATIELTADFCTPRDALVEHCENPIIPPQCPGIFPGA